MAIIKFILASVLLVVGFQEIQGHGKLIEPVGRSSAWRRGFKTPVNYDDSELYCGGITPKTKSGGKCGVCGDNYNDKIPRANENGGRYGTGTIVQMYKEGQHIKAKVHLGTSHLGYFEFAVCPLDDQAVETEECFEKYPLQLSDGSGTKFPITQKRNGIYHIKLELPAGLTCKHCSFRWDYTCGNNWGKCKDGSGKMGCGAQETFRSCADITIVEDEASTVEDFNPQGLP